MYSNIDLDHRLSIMKLWPESAEQECGHSRKYNIGFPRTRHEKQPHEIW
eukprot:CCRYP_007132-RA/>CCRYP_007132-RA protein AED:0.48 eAED:0.48 QI:0/-1/0/1/-1/0/1/0/48